MISALFVSFIFSLLILPNEKLINKFEISKSFKLLEVHQRGC
jgi:hypothetical protein